MVPRIAGLTAGGETAALVGKGAINRGTPSIARRKADAIALKARIAISAVHHLVMFAPALGFLVAAPTPHLIPGAIKKTTVLILIIIFPLGWPITSLPFASAEAHYASRARLGPAVAQQHTA